MQEGSRKSIFNLILITFIAIGCEPGVRCYVVNQTSKPIMLLLKADSSNLKLRLGRQQFHVQPNDTFKVFGTIGLQPEGITFPYEELIITSSLDTLFHLNGKREIIDRFLEYKNTRSYFFLISNEGNKR
ncbi:MAG: hypothetical protein WC150_02440 [Bacteroidia bacterium]